MAVCTEIMNTLAIFAEERRLHRDPEWSMDINPYIFIKPEDYVDNPLYNSLSGRISMDLNSSTQNEHCLLGKVDPRDSWKVTESNINHSKTLECTFKVELLDNYDIKKVVGHIEFCITFSEKQGMVSKIRTNSVKHRIIRSFNTPKVAYY
jgi:hypothetical protein